VRGCRRAARVGATSPGPDRISPPRESPVILGPGFFAIVAHEAVRRQAKDRKGEQDTVPFALLALLVVLVAVVLVLLVYLLVRRWL
jgi:cobalamin biosynthesis Mg chelatase CobN